MILSWNYGLGLSVLIFSFVFFYTPMVYAFVQIRKQNRQQQALEQPSSRPHVD